MSKKHIKFSFPKPEEGIVECLWTVEAADEGEAVHKLVQHLTELKRNFSYPPLPIGKTGDPAVIGKELMRRLSLTTEPVAFIVTLHVFIEHWLNQILLKFCPNRDLTRYDFYKKLEIAYCISKIPKSLFQNLSKLNDLRVKVAHSPDYDLTQMDLNYHDCPADFQLSHYKPSYAANAKAHHVSEVLKVVMWVTYSALHNHCMKELGFTMVARPKKEAAKA